MKLALLVMLVACGHKEHAAPEAAGVPHDAAPDAVPCPGTSADCAACGSGDGSACFSVLRAAATDDAQVLWADRGCAAGDRARGTALVNTACSRDSRHCDTRDRLAAGGGFFDAALDDVPKLDLGPLIDDAKGGKPHRP